MQEKGVPEETIKQWIAVSAYETAQPNPWTSKVFRDSLNLFNIIVPGSTRLGYGEGQTVYPDIKASVYGLFDHVIEPFDYPLSFPSINAQVRFMKSRGYFTLAEDKYLAGVLYWYDQLYPPKQV